MFCFEKDYLREGVTSKARRQNSPTYLKKGHLKMICEPSLTNSDHSSFGFTVSAESGVFSDKIAFLSQVKYNKLASCVVKVRRSCSRQNLIL